MIILINELNMNELIECEQYKYPLIFDVNNKITINRIKQFIKHKSLMNVYSKRYNILEKNLLISLFIMFYLEPLVQLA